MRRKNASNIVLISGVMLSIFTGVVLKNIFLAMIVSVGTLLCLIYKQRASFKAGAADKAYKKGDIEKSFKLYEEACGLNDCEVMIKMTYAYRLMAEGHTKQSSQLLKGLNYNEMTKIEQLNYNATNALIIWKEGNIRRAIDIYEALLHDKESMLIYETLGYLYNEARAYLKGIELSKKGLELYPKNERIQTNLATSYRHQGEKRQAIKEYKALISEYALIAEPYYEYSLMLENDGRYKSAKKYLTMALDRKYIPLYSLTKEQVAIVLERVEEKVIDDNEEIVDYKEEAL